MNTRENALRQWLQLQLKHSNFSLTPLTGDASFRRYLRLHVDNKRFMVMDASSEKHSIDPFVRIATQLSKAGIHAPTLYEMDAKLGFIILEDLGDELLFNQANILERHDLYQASIDTIISMQQTMQDNTLLPAFNRELILAEFNLYQEWFLKTYLSLNLSAKQTKQLDVISMALVNELTAQPQVFVHRDYHSRNIMLTPANDNEFKLNLIDFQDAVKGPWTYDLVSLLKDCYIKLSDNQRLDYLTYFYQKIPNNHGYSFVEFKRAFDLCGLQRHLKVLGIFSRLHFRDRKSNYLSDLPLVFDYVMTCLKDYAEFGALYEFMQQYVEPRFRELTRHA